MKDIILQAAIDYKKSKIDAEEAMSIICKTLFPKKDISDRKLRELIGFIFDVEPEHLHIIESGRNYKLAVPKHLYRTLLFEKYGSKTEVAKMCGLETHASIYSSINAHNNLMVTDKRYKRIYKAINTILTELL